MKNDKPTMANDNKMCCLMMAEIGIVVWLFLQFAHPLSGIENWRVVMACMGIIGLYLIIVLHINRIAMYRIPKSDYDDYIGH